MADGIEKTFLGMRFALYHAYVIERSCAWSVFETEIRPVDVPCSCSYSNKVIPDLTR